MTMVAIAVAGRAKRRLFFLFCPLLGVECAACEGISMCLGAFKESWLNTRIRTRCWRVDSPAVGLAKTAGVAFFCSSLGRRSPSSLVYVRYGPAPLYLWLAGDPGSVILSTSG